MKTVLFLALLIAVALCADTSSNLYHSYQINTRETADRDAADS